MELAVEALAVAVDQFEGMRAVAVHVTVAVGQTSIAEQEGHLDRKDKIKTSPFGFSMPTTVSVNQVTTAKKDTMRQVPSTIFNYVLSTFSFLKYSSVPSTRICSQQRPT